MLQTQPLNHHFADEIFCIKGGKGAIEGQLIEDLYSHFLKPIGTGFGIHQPKWRGVRVKEFARMRLEGQNP